VKAVYNNITKLNNASEILNILKTEIKSIFQNIEILTKLLNVEECEKIDKMAKDAMDNGMVKSFDVVWFHLEKDKRSEYKGKQIKEKYRKFMQEKRKKKIEMSNLYN
jgi:hypothetical protein